MIQANELRIGNLISIPMCAIYAKVDVIGVKRFCIDNSDIDLDDSETSFDLSDANPIMLDKIWLMRFGFIVYTDFYGKEFAEHVASKFITTGKNDTIWFGNNEFKLSEMTVHRMQNIYFDLTGSELVLSNVPEATKPAL